MKFHAACSAMALALAAQSAAAETQGWYFGAGGGWTTIDPVRFTLAPPAGPAAGNLTFGDNAAFDADFGYKSSWIPVRLEAEFQYARFDASNLKLSDFPVTALNGDAGIASVFANAFYDYPVTDRLGVTLGGGLGAARLDPSMSDVAGDRLSAAGTEFSWQLIGGLTYALTDQFEIEADYRYQGIGDSGHRFFSDGFSSPITLKNKTIQTAMLNLRWYLSPPPRIAPPPPPPPPSIPPLPPPPAVRTFVVFFDFNKSNLTAEATQVIAEAVHTAKSTGAVRVLVTGHTDTVGSASYNLALSERRAEAVKSQMVSDGLDADEIATVGKGFDEPLVPTGPDVREPQNRRAVIDLGG